MEHPGEKRSDYQLEDDNPYSQPHPAIMLVSAYIVERGLILEPFEVDATSNEIKAIPELIQRLAAHCELSSPLMLLIPKKNL